MEKIIKVLNAHPRLKSIHRPIYRQIKKNCETFKKKEVNSSIQIVTNEKKVIYFDITSHSVTDIKTGIQRVVRKFLDYIVEMTGDEYDVICISGLNGYHAIDKDTYQSRNDLMLTPKEGDIYLSIDSNPVQPYEYWDTLSAWQQNGCKIIACVYDLVYIKYPQYVAEQNAVVLLSRWLKHATSNFDGLICISKTVEDELTQWIEENKIHNSKLKTGYFHLGGDFIGTSTSMKDSTSAFFNRMCRNKPLIFIAVATIEPRKGYIELVEAFEELAKKGVDATLVIVGRVGWKYDEIVEKITCSNCYNKSVFWFSDCEDNVLEVLYQIADCYISGSYYEGFGLGIIEASSKGLPVLLRDRPINREVSENKGLYYKDVEALVNIIEEIDKNNNALLEQKKINSLSWKESVAMAWTTIQGMI